MRNHHPSLFLSLSSARSRSPHFSPAFRVASPRRCCRRSSTSPPNSNPPWPQPVASSDPLTRLKSTFQAHASRLRHPAQDSLPEDPRALHDRTHRLIAHLAVVSPRTKRATHAMYAWRTSQFRSRAAPSRIVCGSSNGGESGAGERLERLLELARCEDVVLVVFRWYGGVPLGSQRWKCISEVAKDALERGGFMSAGRPPTGAQGGKKRPRRKDRHQ